MAPRLSSLILLFAFAAHGGSALVFDRTHESEILHETRNFRIFLPSDYGGSGKRYPVVYWFHGYAERHNRTPPNSNYDSGTDYGGDTIEAYVSNHDLIVVKLDGYNPRTPGETYVRPWNIGPVETDRQFPFYFTELVAYIDASYRTIADRNHRATAGFSMGGFMSLWVAGKYPHLVSSASSFMPSSEFFVGPRGFDVEYRHEEMSGNYDGVRTRVVTGARDFIQFYHRRMNATWLFTAPNHETEEADFDHGTPGMAKTLDFHMHAFANPLPKPATWSHSDVYPFFDVWGWSVASNRRSPGITVLENVSKAGFRSSVREWVPGGAALATVKLSVTTDRLYTPRSTQTVTIVQLRDGTTRSVAAKADVEGRITVDLDGAAQEVGIGPAAGLAVTGYRVEGAPWATVGVPILIQTRFLNKGAAAAAQMVRWETPNAGVTISDAVVKLGALAARASGEAPLVLAVTDPNREAVRMIAVVGGQRVPFDVRIYPAGEVAADFQIADSKPFRVYRHATELQELALGHGNADGQANPGESIAILLPDGTGYRAAEVLTDDFCVDRSARESDSWSDYDHVGASAKYSLLAVRSNCAIGHVIHLLVRLQLPAKPDHRLRYAAIDVPVVAAK